MVFRANGLFIRLVCVIVFVLMAAGAQYVAQHRESLPREGEREELEITRLSSDLSMSCTDDLETDVKNERKLVIKEYEGLITIYEKTYFGLRLIKQTDFEINALEPQLKERIRTGIQVSTMEEIEHLLESWDS